jgi:nitrite reductase/ring-hydroxylating ferredoxin subunit
VSKALKYLSEARPEAMEAYFSFLRKNGERLDPRTRALISIITKVANQTESGLRQYALKAVRDGISSDEILDSIMMAFPALGLSKTIWAIDVLLDCGVLIHDNPDVEQDSQWHDICAVDSEYEFQILECDGRNVFASRDKDAWRVFDAKCTHHGASLAFCDIRSGEVECPLHGWRFSLKNGDCVRFGMKDLEEMETKVIGARLFASW